MGSPQVWQGRTQTPRERCRTLLGIPAFSFPRDREKPGASLELREKKDHTRRCSTRCKTSRHRKRGRSQSQEGSRSGNVG